MKGLKLWQAILLIFGSICVATGGVFLYTYLTSGFGNEVIEAENINFKTDDSLYNINLNQFEVDGNFSLVVNATNEDVTEKNLTLSFAKKLSNESLSTERTYVKDGVTYITNGIIAIPQNATIGTPFNVIVEQKEYQYDGVQSFIANVGGITTIHAKSSNKLDSVGANVTIAVDVPVKEIKLTARDTTNGKEYSITNDEIKVLQNTNFEIVVNYYPVSSRYRYSDNLHKEYAGVEDYTARVKDYCFEISAGTDIQKQYNGGEVYFTSSANLTTGNKISTYVFASAKKQEDFEKTVQDIEGENYYNAMLSYLFQNKADRVKENILNCTITQAEVGNMFILNSSFEAKTNKLFILTANNNSLGNGNLGLSISDTENAALSSMISQTAIRVSYKKAGEVGFTYLTETDKTIVVKSIDRTVVGTTMQNNPYKFTDGYLYFFPTTNVKNLNNAYWEISTSETAIEIKIEVVLFKTQDGITSIFDESGDKLTGTLTRTAIINVTENEEETDVAWLGNLTENLSIIYNGAHKVPSQIDISTKTSVPMTNTYQTVKYFVRKTYDKDGAPVDDDADISDDVNVGNSFIINGKKYHEALTSEMLFKSAGTYAVIFTTIKTDAYGNVLYEYEDDGITVKGYQIAKTSSEITIIVSETLQSFKETVLEINGDTANGVFVKTKDTERKEEKTYYTYNTDTKTYAKSTIDSFAEGTDYYELSYYAIKSGAESTIILNIEVAESSTDMLKGEINDKDNLKFYAVSADGSIEIPLTLVEMGTTDWTKDDEGNAIPTRISYYLSLDSKISVLSDDGKGQGFYIVSRYFNTIETIESKIQLDNYAITKEFNNGGTKEYYNCFMIYTPDARSIENADLKNNNFDVTVGIDSYATYSQCTIKYTGGDNITPEVGKTGKDWLNDKLSNTIVLDAYGRKFGTQGANYTVRTSQGANAVFVVDNKLDFASGKESAEITVLAGNVSYAFNLKVESTGISSFKFDSEKFTNFNNIAINLTLNKNDEKAFNISIGINNDTSSITNKYIYLKDTTTNAELLKMFSFTGKSNAEITELTTTTPIMKLKLNEFFAQSASLTFYVSNKDYSNSSDTSKETVRFEFTINFTANVNSEVNFNDSADAGSYNGEAEALTDAVYAGYNYSLDKLISLKYNNSGTDEAISWLNSQYVSALILTDGSIIGYDIDQEENAIGIISDNGQKIMFYDVATVKNYPIKLYYFTDNNNYAYHCEINVKVAPNIIFKHETTQNTEINIFNLKTANIGVTNYYSLSRSKGIETIFNVFMNVLTDQMPIDFTNSGEYNTLSAFVFSTGAFEYDYNEYSKQIKIGLSLNGETICDKDGDAIVYDNLYAVVRSTASGESGEKYHTNLVAFINSILTTATSGGGNPVHSTMYDGVLALEVVSGKPYYLNPNVTDVDFDININSSNTNLYTWANSSKKIEFLPADANENEMIFGNKNYIYVMLKNKGEESSIAVIKVPVCVSSVGDVYAFYDNEDMFAKESGKIVQSENYDLKTLLYGDENGEPYATMIAGQEIQIAFTGSRIYDETLGKYYYSFAKEGIYYDAGADVTITFEDDTKQNKYATILNDAYGKHYIHFANYAGEDVLLILKVRVDSGSSHLEYTYRIMLQANITAKTTYPLATGENAAEYVTVASSESYNLANVFGSYAGTKANSARFATEIEVIGTTLVYDSTKEYYFQQGASEELLNGQHILKAGKYIADTAGNTYTLTKSIILSDVSETLEQEIMGVPTTLVRLKLAEETYLIKELEVGGNASGSAQGVTFGTFTTSETKTQNEYSVVYLIDDETKKYTISANESVIAEITLTKAGMLNVSVYNNDYYINLIIRRELTNVVDGDLDYRFFINNESGTTYIEYNKSTGESFATYVENDYKKAETTIVSGTNYNLNLYTKYSTDAGTSMTDVVLDDTPQIELSYTEDGEEKTIANNGTITNISLSRVSAGSYTLSFLTKTFIDRDYVVKFIFNSGDKTISTLYATLKCSVNVEDELKDEIYGGETISTTWIRNKFNFTNASGTTINNVDFSGITSADEGEIISTDGKISSLISDVQNVTIDVKLSTSGNEFYRTLTFNIKKNITVKSSVIYGEKHYAGETISYSTTNFYDGTFSNGSLSSTVEIPLSYEQYINKATVSGTTIRVETNDVKTIVNNARVIVKFNYVSVSGYEYNFQSEFVFNILPNVKAEANYPQPTDDIEYTNESVYFNESYSDFFNSPAVFTKSEKARVIYSNSKDGTAITTADKENATVFVSNIFGMEIYAEVKDKKAEDLGSYYTRGADGTFSYAGGATYNASETYYYKFDVTDHARELKGLEQNFYFAHYGAYADGYATFTTVCHEVEAEYKIYAYDKVVDMEIVNSVNTVDGVEEIFLDQLTEGNVFAENSVARLSMGELPSGTYYIKISNNGNVANQYHWVGFTYDATKGNSINVLLGESASLELDDLGNPIFGDNTFEKGRIIGLYASREGGEELFSQNSATISLCAIANMSYKYNNGTSVEYVGIDSAYLYTNLVKRQILGKTETSTLKLVYKYKNKWYNAENDEKVAISDANLVYYLYGNYEAYEKYVEIDGNKTYVSNVSETIVAGINGFGQILEQVKNTDGTNGKIKNDNAYSENVYAYTNSDDETVYVAKSNAKQYYQATEGYALELNESDSTFASTVGTKSDAVDKDFTHFTSDGYIYFVTRANTKIKLTNAYEKATDFATGLAYKYSQTGTTDVETFTALTEASGAWISYISEKAGVYGNYLKIKANNSGIFSYFTLYKDSSGSETESQSTFSSSTYYYIKVQSNSSILNYNCYQLIERQDYYYYSGKFYTIKGTYYRIDEEYFASQSVGTIESYSLSDLTIDGSCYVCDKYVTLTKPTYDFDNSTIWFARAKLTKENIIGKIFSNANDSVKDDSKKLIDYLTTGSGLFTDVAIYQDYLGAKYIAKSTDSVYILDKGTKDVYKNETVRKTVNTATSVNDASVKTIGNYYYYNGAYYNKNDVVTTKLNSHEYQVINLEDFNISHVSGMVIDDTTAQITFQYIIGEKKDSFDYKFRLKLDVEVRNSITSTNTTSSAGKVEIDEFTPLNYIEIETNKEYNFNELVQVTKMSSGEVLEIQDVRSSTLISIEVVDKNDTGLSEDVKQTLNALGDDFKTNNENILLSYEMIKTQSGGSGIVYNFNLMPLGADNNGDYILVKYTYTVKIADFVWKNTTATEYKMTKYVLFKILPDYEVSMHDLSNLPVTIYEEKLENGYTVLTNEENPVVLENFDEVGILSDATSLKEILGVADGELTTFVDKADGTKVEGNDYINSGLPEDEKYTVENMYATINKTTNFKKAGEVGNYYIIEVTSGENKGKWYLLKTDCVNGQPDKFLLSTNLSKNYQLNVTDSYDQTIKNATNPIIKVTSKNAINSLRDITSANFEAVVSAVEGTTATGDIEKYLTSQNCEMEAPYKIEREEAIKFIVKDVSIGQREFCITLTDTYGYVIKFFFTLEAPSNPKYATGALEFVEGKTFDIGAQYEEITVSEYHIQNTIFYPVTSNFSDYIKKGLLYSKEPTDGTDTIAVKLVSKVVGTEAEEQEYYTTNLTGGGTEISLCKYSSGGAPTSGTYYVKLDSEQAITTTTDLKTALNLPDGKDESGKTKMYISNTNYINIPNDELYIKSVSPTTMSPVEDSDATTPTASANYIDTIELGGIEAFGYKNKNEQAKSSDSKYYTDEFALQKLTVKDVKFKYKNDDGTYTELEKAKLKDGGEKTLATTNDLYKFGGSTEDDKIGRDVIKDNYKIPEMPGWIYGNKDYAYIYMFINLQTDTGETYSLPIEIKMTKQDDRLIEDKISATNVSDNVEFDVKSHFTKNDTTSKTPEEYYNDTIVVTLPKAPAKVTLKITAEKTIDGETQTLTGTTILSANSTTMDTTHYVSISKVVGKTLDPTWTVEAWFSDYDLTAVTRSGNFGFYATYNYGVSVTVAGSTAIELATLSQTAYGQNKLTAETSYNFVYGYGKTKASDTNQSKFTLIESYDNKIYFAPTEKISDNADGTGTMSTGATMLEAKKDGTGAYVKDDNDNYCLPDVTEVEFASLSAKYAKSKFEVDKLYLADMGSLTNGYQQITKYYIVKYVTDGNAEYYQYDKIYNIYPTYYNATTTSIINRIDAFKTGENGNYYEFEVSNWGEELDLQTPSGKSYNSIGSIKLSEAEIGCFYFELGDKNTTAATISSDGTLRVKKSEYNLNGDEYVTINMYVKASGELGEYNSDKLDYSGNMLNTPLITIRLYLNGETEFNLAVEKIAKLEELAGKWIADTAYSTYTARQLAVMYIRTTPSKSYTTAEWNGLAGTIPADFVTYVSNNKTFTSVYGTVQDVTTLRTLTSLTPNGTTEEIDFIHLMAVINMYDEGITPSGTYSYVYPTYYDKTDIADLGGWAGDLVDLITYIKDETGDYATLLNKAKEAMGSSTSGFGTDDYYADLDASNIWNNYLKGKSTSLANALKEYYKDSYKTRATTFKTNEGMTSITVDQLKSRLLENELINADDSLFLMFGINGLMQTRGISTSTHADHIKAACEAFLIYLSQH